MKNRRQEALVRYGMEVRACLHTYDPEDKGLSCYRDSLPGRLLCHKHAGLKAQKDRRRRERKTTRALRQRQRRKGARV